MFPLGICSFFINIYNLLVNYIYNTMSVCEFLCFIKTYKKLKIGLVLIFNINLMLCL